MARNLDDGIAELYAGPLVASIPGRDELAKNLTKAGDRETAARQCGPG